MTDYDDSKLALKAELYLQRKAFERKVHDAAFDAIRTIAAGCSDPVGRAKYDLDLDASFDEPRSASPVSASRPSKRRKPAGNGSGADVRG
jgi:hypothetical protein